MWLFSSLPSIDAKMARHVCGAVYCPMTRPEGRQSIRAPRLRACRRRERRRLQRQRWHGCYCRYGGGSGGGRVHVGSVRGACAPAAGMVPSHRSIAARAAGDGAGAGRVGAGALTTNGVVNITSAAPDAARTLSGSCLAVCADDNPAIAPNHAAEGRGSRAGGRALGGPHASGTPAARGTGEAAPCARAGA
jgi:hypothetical protein